MTSRPLRIIPYQKIKRRPQVKAVTIGVGFKCADGILICADNQITWPQYHKYYDCKIYWHGSGSDWAVLNTFAGNPDLVKSFNGKFDAAMASVKQPYSPAQIQDVIETVLSFLDVLDNAPDDLWMLCGIVVPPNGMRLVKTHGKVVSETHEGHDYVGVGDSSLLRYLSPLLLGRSGALYSTKQALSIGVYLVLQAKRYVDGCGGDTDIFVLRPNAHVEPRSTIYYSVEQHLLRLEKTLGDTSKMFFDTFAKEAEFGEKVDSLCKRLKQERPTLGT